MLDEQQSNQNPNENNTETQQLYAGKFKSVEDLEAGYKNAAKVFDENQQLKSQLETITKVPDDYMHPADVELDQNRLADIKARAKEAGMTQAQYEKFVKSDKDRLEKMKSHFEEAKKALGEDKLNLLNDFIAKAYPKEIADGVLKSAVTNKAARDAILQQREHALNNRVPGMDRVATPTHYSISDDDIKKAYIQKEKTGSIRDIERYMNLLTQKASQG